MSGVENQVMNSRSYVYAIRFVLDQDTTMYRFFSSFVMQGATGILCSQSPCHTGYGAGNGGIIDARLVTVNADGTPDLTNVLAEEKVNAVQRWSETKAAYGITTAATGLLYLNMNGVALKAGQLYAMTYRNVDPNPSVNWFSEDSPTVNQPYAGPNGANNLNPTAPGAIDNLDPRETVTWSQNDGSGWVWGYHVGEGPTTGSYAGDTTGDYGARLPWYGWQTSPTATPQSTQPYYAYAETGAYTVNILNNTGNTLRFTQAGGYALTGNAVGRVTVTNLATGVTASTGSLGGGLTEGALTQPITVTPGDRYSLTNTGSVAVEEADGFQQSIFQIGTNSPIQTAGHGPSRAELFAR